MKNVACACRFNLDSMREKRALDNFEEEVSEREREIVLLPLELFGKCNK